MTHFILLALAFAAISIFGTVAAGVSDAIERRRRK